VTRAAFTAQEIPLRVTLNRPNRFLGSVVPPQGNAALFSQERGTGNCAEETALVKTSSAPTPVRCMEEKKHFWDVVYKPNTKRKHADGVNPPPEISACHRERGILKEAPETHLDHVRLQPVAQNRGNLPGLVKTASFNGDTPRNQPGQWGVTSIGAMVTHGLGFRCSTTKILWKGTSLSPLTQEQTKSVWPEKACCCVRPLSQKPDSPG